MTNYTVRILPAAEQAVLEQAQYIAANNLDAALAWMERVWDAVDDRIIFRPTPLLRCSQTLLQ